MSKNHGATFLDVGLYEENLVEKVPLGVFETMLSESSPDVQEETRDAREKREQKYWSRFEQILSNLSPKEREAANHRYGLDNYEEKSVKGTAKAMKITPNTVRSYLRNVEFKFRRLL